MELLMALMIGMMFAAGTYLILQRNFIRIVMGFTLYSNAANLLLITCGGFSLSKQAPFVKEQGTAEELATALMDPLPPDIILTAIVISFAVGALLLTTCYRVYLDHGTDDPSALVSIDEAEPDRSARSFRDDSGHDPVDVTLPPDASAP